MRPRHLLSWKPLFYEALLPVLRRLGPARAEVVLEGLGRVASIVVPGRKRVLDRAAGRALAALGPAVVPDRRALRSDLAAGVARHLARDYLLDGASDAALAERFDVQGFANLQDALREGRGVVLLGSHLGAHLSGLHWLIRQGVPLRMLVQRPRHVSKTLDRWFDRDEPAHPQSMFFLHRRLAPAEAVGRVLRARDALRDGMGIYLNGDIPWSSPNARPGTLLGREQPFLAIWADLAMLAPAPVVAVFCTHQPGGRHALSFDPPFAVGPRGQAEAVARYLARLDAEIAAHPAEAIPHLTWPAYNSSASPAHRSDPETPPPPAVSRPCRIDINAVSTRP